MKEELKANVMEMHKAYDTAGVLQIRLNSDFILQRVRTYLTGEIENVIYDKEGKPVIERKKIAESKANEEGIQTILNFIENIVNPQAVQGNFTDEQYEKFIAEIHQDLIENIMNNLYNWGINEDNYEPMIDNFMVLLIPFLSRLVDNEERKSYAQTIKAAETSQINRMSSGLFNKG